MEEVEEEEEEEESIADIDGGDADDPLAVVEYVDDILAHYHETEVSLLSLDYFAVRFSEERYEMFDLLRRLSGVLCLTPLCINMNTRH